MFHDVTLLWALQLKDTSSQADWSLFSIVLTADSAVAPAKQSTSGPVFPVFGDARQHLDSVLGIILATEYTTEMGNL